MTPACREALDSYLLELVESHEAGSLALEVLLVSALDVLRAAGCL